MFITTPKLQVNAIFIPNYLNKSLKLFSLKQITAAHL